LKISKSQVLSLVFILVCFLSVAYLFKNLQQNLSAQNIATGFSFLKYEAGFEIGESLIAYDSFDTYQKALFVGLLNTFKMALVSSFFAFIIGLFFGVLGISKNRAIKSLSSNYINVTRNIPLLLQLFFWYALFTDIFPSVRLAEPFLGITLSNRGIYFPWFTSTSVTVFFLLTITTTILLVSYFVITRLKKFKGVLWSLINILFLLFFLKLFMSLFSISFPELKGFNIVGGRMVSPEYCALFLGLTIYTGAFMAEIIRAGILSVDKGQWEAAKSLGLSEVGVLRYVIIPQSFKVSLPPLISQFLNLTKNSSLAVAIGYPDFVSISNTTMNQTGQAIELVVLIMAVYLSISLLTSVILNKFGRKNYAK
tara:strand:+ start:194 stop:1294 length:1101 start_codon:yes stop_codon:yes gene_type:complete